MFSATGDVDEAADRIARVDAVLFTETFAGDLAALARRLRLPLAPRRERGFGADVTLSPAEIVLARERLAPEIALVERLRAVRAAATSGQNEGSGAG
jgi:citrate lyase beta subunit